MSICQIHPKEKVPYRFLISSTVNGAGARGSVVVYQNHYIGPAKIRILFAFAGGVNFDGGVNGLYVRSSLPQRNAYNNEDDPANILCFIPNRGHLQGDPLAPTVDDLQYLTIQDGDIEQAYYEPNVESFIYTEIPASFEVYLTQSSDNVVMANTKVLHWTIQLEVIPI